jgi:hypothetical protein
VLLIDDALLLRAIARTAGAELSDAGGRGELFTTGYRYYRLARAVRQSPWAARSRPRLPISPTDSVAGRSPPSTTFPDDVGLLDLRTVVPTMAALDVGRQLNLLAAEALAAALLLGAEVLVATDAPLIREGAAHLRLSYRLVDA